VPTKNPKNQNTMYFVAFHEPLESGIHVRFHANPYVILGVLAMVIEKQIMALQAHTAVAVDALAMWQDIDKKNHNEMLHFWCSVSKGTPFSRYNPTYGMVQAENILIHT